MPFSLTSETETANSNPSLFATVRTCPSGSLTDGLAKREGATRVFPFRVAPAATTFLVGIHERRRQGGCENPSCFAAFANLQKPCPSIPRQSKSDECHGPKPAMNPTRQGNPPRPPSPTMRGPNRSRFHGGCKFAPTVRRAAQCGGRRRVFFALAASLHGSSARGASSNQPGFGIRCEPTGGESRRRKAAMNCGAARHSVAPQASRRVKHKTTAAMNRTHSKKDPLSWAMSRQNPACFPVIANLQ